MQVRQMEIEESRRKEAADKVEKDRRREELAGLRSSSRSGASGQVRNYFSTRGVDPEQYSGSIEEELNSIMNSIDPEESNPGQFFKDAPATVYGNLEQGRRTRATDDVDRIFGQNFDTQRIPFTMDDPYLAGIESEQYQDADSIIRNMLDRGVLTATGAGSARTDLENQRPGVKTRLNEIGTGVLSSGQQRLRDISNTAHQTAGELRLGQQFDPYSYQTEADSVFDEFVNTLGDQIRGRVTGKLFNTAGLAAIGGAGQGAGNGAFDPNASAGIIDDHTADDDDNPNSIF